MLALFLLSLLGLMPVTESVIILGVLFGPDTPMAVFKGQVTQNGRPVPALLSLEVLYKLNGNLVPLSLVQVNSLPNYEIHLSGLALRNENITNHAILRAQSLSIDGGSRQIKLHLKDGKLLYQQNIELNADYEEEYYYDDYNQHRQPVIGVKNKNLRHIQHEVNREDRLNHLKRIAANARVEKLHGRTDYLYSDYRT